MYNFTMIVFGKMTKILLRNGMVEMCFYKGKYIKYLKGHMPL